MIRFKPKENAYLYSSDKQFGIKLNKRQVWYGRKAEDKWEMQRDEVRILLPAERIGKYFEVE